MTATGESYWTFERDWLKRVRRSFNPLYLFIDQGLFWLLVSLLFILVYVLIRLRNRRRLRQWTEEENELLPGEPGPQAPDTPA